MLRGLAGGLLGTLVCLAMVAGGWAAVFHDDPLGTLARLRGEPLSVSPAESWVGTGVPGEEATFTASVTNGSKKEVRLLGLRSCACSVAEEFPIAIPAGGAGHVTVRIRFPAGPGEFAGRFAFFTDDKSQPLVAGRFSGRSKKR